MRKANSLRKAASPTPHKVLPLTLVTLCIIAIVGITLWRLPPSRTVAAVVPTPSPVSSIAAPPATSGRLHQGPAGGGPLTLIAAAVRLSG